MGTFMKQIASIFSLILALASVGCQTTATTPSNTESAALETTAPESTKIASAEEEQAAWQSTLSEDLAAVERLGQIFLESSFALYDRLLNEEISEKDTDAARTAVEDCRGKYNQLVSAINKLKSSLSRAEVQEALPLSVDGNKEELDELLTSLTLYVPAEFSREDYTVGEGKYLTAMMFPGLAEEQPDYLSSLPKANRDALLFLDHLKRISGDLSNLSSTLTAWIYDSSSFDAEAFVH
jgi:hypothetical protein